MKVILQSFEPMPQPFASAHVPSQMVTNSVRQPVRKAKFRLAPVVSDARLFHAL